MPRHLCHRAGEAGGAALGAPGGEVGGGGGGGQEHSHHPCSHGGRQGSAGEETAARCHLLGQGGLSPVCALVGRQEGARTEGPTL